MVDIGMEQEIKGLLAAILLVSNWCIDVHGYCVPGTDTTIDVIQPLNSKKASVRVGGETILEVRYKGSPEVRWHVNGKEIPANTKSTHFEFMNDGTSSNMVGPKLKIKNFKNAIAGEYKITINKGGCTNSKSIKVEIDKTFDLQYYIDLIFKKVPYLKTKAGICLLLAGFVFVFIIIPLMICGALCSKIRKIKKELQSEKGKMEMYFQYENKKGHKHHKSKSTKKSAPKEKSSHKEKQPLMKDEDDSSSEDLPNARPPKKH